MAFLRKREKSPFWYACFNVQTPSGGWKQISKCTKIRVDPPSGLNDREEERLLAAGVELARVTALKEAGMTAGDARKLAQKVADAWESAMKKGWTVSHIRRVMRDLTFEVAGDDVAVPTVRTWCEEFVSGLPRKGKAPSTVRNYRNALNRFLCFLGERAELALDQLTPKIMNDFALWLAERFSVPTVRKEFVSVSACLMTAVRLGVLDRSPSVGVELPKERVRENAEPSRRGFTLDELKTVLERCDEEWRSMVLCSLYLGGQRLGDVAVLRWSAVDLERGVVSFQTIKTGRAMTVPMIPALRAHLKRWRQVSVDTEFVHPKCAREYECRGSNRLSTVFSGILFDAGLIGRDPRLAGKRYKKQGGAREDKRRHKNALSFHSLRYTVTTMLHDAGVVPAMVQEIVGHSSAQVHSGYIKFGAEATEKALEKLPEL